MTSCSSQKVKIKDTTVPLIDAADAVAAATTYTCSFESEKCLRRRSTVPASGRGDLQRCSSSRRWSRTSSDAGRVVRFTGCDALFSSVDDDDVDDDADGRGLT